MPVSSESMLVFTSAVAIVALTAVAPADADPEPSTETAAPTALPLEAVLSGREVARADAEGLVLTLSREEGQMILAVKNEGPVAKSVDWDVDCASVRGSLVGRMGPLVIPVEAKHVAVSLAPGASERVVLAAPLPAGDEPPPIMPIDAYRVVVVPHSEAHLRAAREALTAGATGLAVPTPMMLLPESTPVAFLQLEG